MFGFEELADNLEIQPGQTIEIDDALTRRGGPLLAALHITPDGVELSIRSGGADEDDGLQFVPVGDGGGTRQKVPLDQIQGKVVEPRRVIDSGRSSS